MTSQRDHGFAWVALAAMCFLNIMYAFSFSTLGIFMVEFLGYFETSTSNITWIGSVNMLFGNFASIFGGPLLKKLGSRLVLGASSILVCISLLLSGLFPNLLVLYVCYGACSGIGFLFFHTGGLVIIQHWFDKRRSLASGIYMSGMSIGVFIWPPVVRWLIDLYSWQGTFIVLGGVFFNGLLGAAILRKSPIVTSSSANGTKSNSLANESDHQCEIFCSKLKKFSPLCIFYIGVALVHIGHMNMFIYTPVRAEDLNIDRQYIPIMISVMGLAGILFRPIAGFIGDSPKVNRTIMFGACAIVAGGSGMLETLFTTFPLLVIPHIIFGISCAGYAGIVGAVLVDIAGLENIEIASNLFVGAMGIGNFLLHPIAGAVLDSTGNSTILFWIFGALQSFGGLLILLIPLLQRIIMKSTTKEISKKDSEILPDVVSI